MNLPFALNLRQIGSPRVPQGLGDAGILTEAVRSNEKLSRLIPTLTRNETIRQVLHPKHFSSPFFHGCDLANPFEKESVLLTLPHRRWHLRFLSFALLSATFYFNRQQFGKQTTKLLLDGDCGVDASRRSSVCQAASQRTRWKFKY